MCACVSAVRVCCDASLSLQSVGVTTVSVWMDLKAMGGVCATGAGKDPPAQSVSAVAVDLGRYGLRKTCRHSDH